MNDNNDRYVDGFNLGYQLAKEEQSFPELDTSQSEEVVAQQYQGIKDGVKAYEKELEQSRLAQIVKSTNERNRDDQDHNR